MRFGFLSIEDGILIGEGYGIATYDMIEHSPFARLE